MSGKQAKKYRQLYRDQAAIHWTGDMAKKLLVISRQRKFYKTLAIILGIMVLLLTGAYIVK
jgi:hypothetical protein